jgi:peptidyl-prolyl cis-trans isomerase C
MLAQMHKAGFAAVVVAAMALLAAPVTAQAKADDNTVVATVNGAKILKKDVMGTMKTLSVKDEDAEKVFPMVVDQMINENLINTETAKSNIEQDPAFQQRLAAAKDQLIKTFYLENYLKDKVNDKTVKAAYEKIKKENKGKEEVHARHILLKSEEEAKQVIKDLDSGAKFEDLARERSSDPGAKNGGDLGYFTKDEMVPEFSAAAFSTKPGTYTKEPVKSQFGWHVILVEDKRQRSIPDLKEVESSLRNKLGQDAVQKLVQDLRAKADIKRFGMDGKPLEEPKKN